MKKIKLIYIGRRLLNDGALVHDFKDIKSEKTYSWKKVKFCVIGEVYFATKTEGRTLMDIRPESLGPWEATIEEIEGWQALEVAAEQADKQRKLSIRLSKKEGLSSELNRLRKITKGLSFGQKTLFVEWLVDELSKKEVA